MITQRQREHLVESLPGVLACSKTLSRNFHRHVFERRSELRALFASDGADQERSLVHRLEAVLTCMKHEAKDWRAAVEPEQDLGLVLLAMTRRDQALYRVPDEAHLPVGEALLAALDEEASLDLSDDARQAWAQCYADLSKLVQVASASKVHPAPREPKSTELLMSGELDEFELQELLRALSLCEQWLKISLQDEVERPSGALLLKSGQVLEADCQDEGGQPAFRLLLMRPHHRFRVERVPEPSPAPAPIGGVAQLLESCLPQVDSRDLVDPASLAANGAPALRPEAKLGDRIHDEDEDEEGFESGRPTPVMTPIPLLPLAPLVDQRAQGAQAPDASIQPLSLTRIVLPWIPKLKEIPHLRGFIMLEHPGALEGKFWSQDGAQISVADLGKYAQGCIRAQAQLPRLSRDQDPVGYRCTTEHRLGCVVTDVDGNGRVRVCLFDPATPLGKVRHTVQALIALSAPKPSTRRG